MVRFLVAFLVLSTAFLHPAVAQQTTTKTAPVLLLKQGVSSHPEHILMSYYKQTGLVPDFLNWAQKSPFLNDANKSDYDVIIARENKRLSEAFSDPDFDNTLNVKVDVKFDNYSTLQEKLHLSEFTSKTFFSFSIYGEHVAVVPQDITAFSEISLTKAQMDEILKKTSGAGAEVEFFLTPVLADAETPFVYKGRAYKLLLAKIGEIRLWSISGSDPVLLWMQRADWYKPKMDETLLNLKGGK